MEIYTASTGFKILKKFVKQRYLFIMIAPAVILTAVFSYIPLAGWYMAFVDYTAGKNLWKCDWIGLKQFKTFFTMTTDFGYLMRNTLVINLVNLFLGLTLAMVFALLLKELPGGFFKRTVQTASFFPFFISWVVVFSLFTGLLAVNSGALNYTMVKLGLLKEGINVLGEGKYAWPLIWLTMIWKNTGYNATIFLASISGISKEQYESADIDGAGRFQKITYITIPNLVSTLIVLLVINSGYLLRSSLDMFFMFTNSTNWEYMEVLDMYIYKFGLKLGDYSYATAVGIMMTVASIILLLCVNGLSKRFSGRAIL